MPTILDKMKKAQKTAASPNVSPLDATEGLAPTAPAVQPNEWAAQQANSILAGQPTESFNIPPGGGQAVGVPSRDEGALPAVLDDVDRIAQEKAALSPTSSVPPAEGDGTAQNVPASSQAPSEGWGEQAPPFEQIVPETGTEVRDEIGALADNNRANKDNTDKDTSRLIKALEGHKAFAETTMNLYKQERDALRAGELWETMIGAIGQIAAGLYGLKTNMDMSGIPIQKSNWAQRLEDARKDMADAISLNAQEIEIAKLVDDSDNKKQMAINEANKDLWNRGMKEAQLELQEDRIRLDRARERRIEADRLRQERLQRDQLARQREADAMRYGQASRTDTRAEERRAETRYKEFVKAKTEAEKDIEKLVGERFTKGTKAREKPLEQQKAEVSNILVRQARLAGMEIDKAEADVSAEALFEEVPGMIWGTNPPPPEEMQKRIVPIIDGLFGSPPERRPARAGAGSEKRSNSQQQQSISEAQLQAYASTYKMSPADAKAYLESQGYVIE